MYECGSPISYTSCSVTDGMEMRPPVFGMLHDDERPVSRRLDDRIADVGEIGDVLPVVQAVAAGALRAALDDVAGDDSGRETIPVVGAPSRTRGAAAPS